MKIENLVLTVKGINIPVIKMTNGDNLPDIIVMHGYGGNKEEQLGLSFRLANFGFNTYSIDLRGHGENELPLSYDIKNDLDNLIDEIRKPSLPVITIGHSLGGRLSLISKADYRIGLSPALGQSFSDQTKTIIKNLRQHRVNPENADINFEILSKLPLAEPTLNKTDLIIYGSRDVPEIIQKCSDLSTKYDNVIEINNAMHSDIFLMENTFTKLKRYLKEVVK